MTGLLKAVVQYVPKMYKAVGAAIGAASAAYASLEVTGGPESLTPDQWIVVVAAGLAALVSAWLPRNRQ